jgi:hypothetical protein
MFEGQRPTAADLLGARLAIAGAVVQAGAKKAVLIGVQFASCRRRSFLARSLYRSATVEPPNVCLCSGEARPVDSGEYIVQI